MASKSTFLDCKIPVALPCNTQSMNTGVSWQLLGPEPIQNCLKLPKSVPNLPGKMPQTGGVLQSPRCTLRAPNVCVCPVFALGRRGPGPAQTTPMTHISTNRGTGGSWRAGPDAWVGRAGRWAGRRGLWSAAFLGGLGQS